MEEGANGFSGTNISSGPFAVIDEHLNSILPNCYDAIGLNLMIRIIHQHQVIGSDLLYIYIYFWINKSLLYSLFSFSNFLLLELMIFFRANTVGKLIIDSYATCCTLTAWVTA